MTDATLNGAVPAPAPMPAEAAVPATAVPKPNRRVRPRSGLATGARIVCLALIDHTVTVRSVAYALRVDYAYARRALHALVALQVLKRRMTRQDRGPDAWTFAVNLEGARRQLITLQEEEK
jgi:hypothetical protein